jgi:hypothetical protein
VLFRSIAKSPANWFAAMGRFIVTRQPKVPGRLIIFMGISFAGFY